MNAKEIIVKPIDARSARQLVLKWHYSKKFDPRSSLHFGVFLGERCGGVMQFGPSMDKRKIQGLVQDTKWNGFLELNRMAFAEWLPRNSESRAIAVVMRLIKKRYPHIEWVVSYSDAAQCGDGTIYRASGFVLTQIKKNTSMYRMPDGTVKCKLVFESSFSPRKTGVDRGVKARYGKTCSETTTSFFKRIGAECLPGFQLRYIYFLNPAARARLAVPMIPFSEIKKVGASMYKGKRVASLVEERSALQPIGGGAIPTATLQLSGDDGGEE